MHKYRNNTTDFAYKNKQANLITKIVLKFKTVVERRHRKMLFNFFKNDNYNTQINIHWAQ